MIKVSKSDLIEAYLRTGKMSRDEMDGLLPEAQKQHKTIFQYLVEKGKATDDEILSFFSDELNIPLFNLSAYRVPKEVTKLVPVKLVERHQVMPLSRVDKLLTVATGNPLDILLYDDLKNVTGCHVVPVLSSAKTISALIEQFYAESQNLDEIIEDMDEDNLEVVKEEKEEKKSRLPVAGSVDDAPVVRLVNLILNNALKVRASDIHFEPYEKEFRVRYRVDGSLHESFTHSKEMYASLVARVKIISQLDITEKRVPQDGRFRIKTQGKEVDFRVSVLPAYFGEKIVLRVLDKAGLKSGLDKLGMTETPTRKIGEAIKSPYGMILVTGPTGSGKSTSLYTLLGTLNTPDRNIMTIEDPVEYQVEGISQTQVISEIGLTFASGLRSLLRQSPDIVLVGEIRDGETADIAVKAALTGHLVFSTLHTNSAAGSVTRLIDMGVEPFLISSSLVCSAAQRLMKKVCQFCKAPYEIPADILRRCGTKADEAQSIASFKGKGCAKCNDTGYYGRTPTIEVMLVDNEIRDLISQRKSSNIIHETAVRKGMETLYENAFLLFKQGITTLDEVLRVSSER